MGSYAGVWGEAYECLCICVWGVACVCAEVLVCVYLVWVVPVCIWGCLCVGGCLSVCEYLCVWDCLFV